MSKRPIYYDTETTGIKNDKDRIIEIAAYDPIGDRSFVKFVNPQIPIPLEASAIHNITDQMVESAGTFKDVGQAFFDFCGADAVLIAHNNDAFDKLFLEAESKRHGLTIPGWPYIDTLKWARKYRADLPRHTLQYLREVYGIAANSAHRALDDVMVLFQVFSQMIDDIPIEKVIEMLSAPTAAPTRMPFGKHQGKALSEIPTNYVEWLKGSGAFEKAENKELMESFVKLGKLS